MPSTANVLQVGPLKPSLAETLRTRYRAQILPTTRPRAPSSSPVPAPMSPPWSPPAAPVWTRH
jgi:hypothetical protein